MQNSVIAMRPMSANTGMEILDLDLTKPLGDAATREIRLALNDWGVVTFRNQHLEPRHQVDFAKRFGDVQVTDFIEQLPGFPEIGLIKKDVEQTRNVGGQWHSDHSFDPVPPLGSVLYAGELPERGGDTMFANMAAAYEALSDGLKKTLEGLRVVHSKRNAAFSDSRAERQADAALMAQFDANAHRECVHPMVARHPDTGRKVLFINANYTSHIDGWTRAESRALLDYLLAEAYRPENVCRFTWYPGSLAMWDNRTANHYALNDYHGSRRVMHRVVLKGRAWPE